MTQPLLAHMGRTLGLPGIKGGGMTMGSVILCILGRKYILQALISSSFIKGSREVYARLEEDLM